MSARTMAPHLRSDDRLKELRERIKAEHERTRRRNASWFCAWLAVVVGAAAAVAMDRQHHQRNAGYYARPSADEVVLRDMRSHRSLDEIMAIQKAMMEKEYAGKRP